MWPLLQFVRTELEANGGVSGGASHKFNPIRHGRETAQIVCNALREVSFFTRRGGLLKIGGDQVLCLRSKGGSKDFFKVKRGDHLYFLKK